MRNSGELRLHTAVNTSTLKLQSIWKFKIFTNFVGTFLEGWNYYKTVQDKAGFYIFQRITFRAGGTSQCNAIERIKSNFQVKKYKH